MCEGHCVRRMTLCAVLTWILPNIAIFYTHCQVSLQRVDTGCYKHYKRIPLNTLQATAVEDMCGTTLNMKVVINTVTSAQ